MQKVYQSLTCQPIRQHFIEKYSKIWKQKGAEYSTPIQNAVYNRKMAGHMNIDIMCGIFASCLFRSTA